MQVKPCKGSFMFFMEILMVLILFATYVIWWYEWVSYEESYSYFAVSI